MNIEKILCWIFIQYCKSSFSFLALKFQSCITQLHRNWNGKAFSEFPSVKSYIWKFQIFFASKAYVLKPPCLAFLWNSPTISSYAILIVQVLTNRCKSKFKTGNQEICKLDFLKTLLVITIIANSYIDVISFPYDLCINMLFFLCGIFIFLNVFTAVCHVWYGFSQTQNFHFHTK